MRANPPCAPIPAAVFMGMGEPLHNLDAVLAACDILCDPQGLHFSYNKVVCVSLGVRLRAAGL